MASASSAIIKEKKRCLRVPKDISVQRELLFTITQIECLYIFLETFIDLLS